MKRKIPDYLLYYFWYAVDQMSKRCKRAFALKTKKDDRPPKKQLKESTEDYSEHVVPLTINVYQGFRSGVCSIPERFQIKHSDSDSDPAMYFLEKELEQLGFF